MSKQQNQNPYVVDTPTGSLMPAASAEFSGLVNGLTEIESVEPVDGSTETKTRRRVSSKAQEGSE